ncbi:MAG: hypothetical protein D6748_00720 [Calditrichaeota bacterium]|nr:MAG: hypothetical protein D6748_00720 [Calditrichota bacterium]
MNRILSRSYLFLCLLLFPIFSQETLPPYHWAYQYIDYLKVQGYFPDLPMNNRPFSREQLAMQLLKVNWERLNQNPVEKGMVEQLYHEFLPEMRELGKQKKGEWKDLLEEALSLLGFPELKEIRQPSLQLGVFSDMGLEDRGKEEKPQGRGEWHSRFVMNWKNRITLYNNFKVFNRAPENYIGKEYRGMFGYVEQGYIGWRSRWIQAKFGRDFLQIGPGRSGQLLMSDNSRPFDMYFLRVGNDVFNFRFWGIMLDRRSVRINEQRPPEFANRYLNGHRFSVNFRNRVFLGVSEVILYGGPGMGWEMGFMNPFTIYYMHNVNVEPGVSAGNVLLNLDWDAYIAPGVEFYGEFLLDDFQIDRQQPADLEPNELGLIAGVKWANPFRVKKTILSLEYIQVRNRTYNVLRNEWEKYLHRNEEIGYAFGNNLERIESNLSYWVSPGMNVQLFANLHRQGEGSVEGEFNTDYLNYTIEEGYDEPFPFGIVERQLQLGLSLFFKPHPLTHIRLETSWNDYSNYQHQTGVSHQEFIFRFSLWLQWNAFVEGGKWFKME